MSVNGSKNIVFITDGIAPFSLGGMQRYITDLIASWDQLKNDNITVFFFADQAISNDKLGEAFQVQSNIAFIQVPFVKKDVLPGHYIRSNKNYSKKIVKQYADRLDDADLIYIQGFTGDAIYKNKSWAQKSVLNLHGLNMLQPTFGLKNKLQQKMLKKLAVKHIKRSGNVISLGGILTSLLQHYKKDKNIIIIPPGLQSSWWTNQVSAKEPIAIFVGRNDDIKRLDWILNYWRKEQPDFKLLVIGPVEEQAIPNVAFLGQINDVKKLQSLYEKAAIALLSSISEGFPLSLLEAKSKGCFLVATNVGAVKELITESNDGILTSVHSQELFHKAIERAIQLYPDYINATIEDRIQKSRAYTWENIVEKTRALAQ